MFALQYTQYYNDYVQGLDYIVNMQMQYISSEFNWLDAIQ